MEQQRRRKFLASAAASITALTSGTGHVLAGPPDHAGGGGGGGNDDGGDGGGTDDDTTEEVIEASGQTIYIDDGQTFANKLIDLSTGEGITIYARDSTNWTIRNIGFDGYYEGGSFAISVSDTGRNGTSRVENVYLGDGASKAGTDFEHGPGAIFLGDEHEGHIDFVECNVQGFPNNGFYCSNGRGTCRWERCYAGNNGVASYRTNTEDEIVNCVGFNDNTDYGYYHEENDYVEENGRPVWVWDKGSVEVIDSHFDAGPDYPVVLGTEDHRADPVMQSGALGRGAVHDEWTVSSDVGSDPVLEPPEGVPTSAEEAANHN